MKYNWILNIGIIKYVENLLLFGYLILAITFYGSIGQTWIPKVVGFIFAGVYFLNLFTSRKRIGAKNISFLLFFLMFFFSYSYIPFDYGELKFIFTLFQVYLLSFIVLNIIRYNGSFYTIIYAMIVGCLLLIYTRYVQMGSLIDIAGARYKGQAGNPNDYSFILMTTLLLILFVLVSKGHSKIKKFFLFLLTVPLTLELLTFGGSRTSIFAYATGFLIFLIIQFIKSGIIIKLMIGFICFGTVVNYRNVLPDMDVFQRFSNAAKTLQGQGNYDVSANDRFELILEGLRIWTESPLFGHGTNAMRNINQVAKGSYAHNNYIELLANNGILGFGFFYLQHIILFYLVNSKWNTKPQGLWYMNIILLALLLADVGMVNYYNKIYLGVLAGCIGYVLFLKYEQEAN